MRLALVFTGQAAPTYVPVGVASLAAAARALRPPLEVRCFDVNLPMWERAAGAVGGGLEALEVLRGGLPGFYDEIACRAALGTLALVSAEVRGLAGSALRYVESGDLDPALGSFLDGQLLEIMGSAPDIVGLSVVFPEQLATALALARRLREGRGRGPEIIIGGAMATAVDVGSLLEACPYVDAVAAGEGEPVMAHLARGGALGSAPGVTLRGRPWSPNRGAPPVDLERLPRPDFSDLDLRRYAVERPVLPVLLSRGCRWSRCRFCAHNASYGRYRRKRVDVFVEELSWYRRELGVSHFYLADQYVGPADLGAVADRITAVGLDIRFSVMARPTAGFTAPLLSKLRAAGCVWVSWGVETGSQRLADLAGKGISIARARRVVELAHRAGISNLLMMLYGLPAGTDADLRETFDFIDAVAPSVDAFTSSAFTLFEGTGFARTAGAVGRVGKGRELLFRARGVDVRSTRLRFMEEGEDGSARPPRGPMEVSRWRERRRWFRDDSILEAMAAEHYLLWAARRLDPLGVGSGPAVVERKPA